MHQAGGALCGTHSSLCPSWCHSSVSLRWTHGRGSGRGQTGKGMPTRGRGKSWLWEPWLGAGFEHHHSTDSGAPTGAQRHDLGPQPRPMGAWRSPRQPVSGELGEEDRLVWRGWQV